MCSGCILFLLTVNLGYSMFIAYNLLVLVLYIRCWNLLSLSEKNNAKLSVLWEFV